MRPTPAQSIAGIRRVLAQELAPQLHSDLPMLRLRELRAVLAQVDWNNQVLDFYRDTVELDDIVKQIWDWANAVAVPTDRPAPPTEPLPSRGRVLTFAELLAWRTSLDAWLVEVGHAVLCDC